MPWQLTYLKVYMYLYCGANLILAPAPLLFVISAPLGLSIVSILKPSKTVFEKLNLATKLEESNIKSTRTLVKVVYLL